GPMIGQRLRGEGPGRVSVHGEARRALGSRNGSRGRARARMARREPGSRLAIFHTARAGTSAPAAATQSALWRVREFPTDGSAVAGRAASQNPPTVRNAPGPRRRIANRSAGGGNGTRPAAKG